MELKDRKWLINNKNSLKLPGFVDGTPSYMLWLSPMQFIPGGPAGLIFGRLDFMTPDQTLNSSTKSGAINLNESPAPTTIGDIRTPEKDKKTLSGGSPNIGQKLGSTIPAALAGAATIYNQYLSNLKDENLFLDEGGTNNSSIGGISYTSYNGPDMSKVSSDNTKNTVNSALSGAAAGASAGAVLGPWGAAIGGVVGGLGGAISGIFGGKKNKEAARNAIALAERKTNYGRNSALSDYLDQLYKLEYGDSKQLVLSAKNGKQVNARVSNGELVGNFDEHYVYKVPGKPNNKDTKYTYLKPNDFVISNKYGLSKLAQLTGDYAGVLDLQNMLMNGYKYGKLPKFAEGWWGNFVPHAISGIASIGQMIDAGNLRPYRPNTYVGNRYANNALSALAGLRINPYNIYPSIYDVYGRTTSSIDRSGGLSSGLRAASKIAAMSLTQTNIANMLTQHLIQNNAYKTNWAEKALATGASDAQARMAANQFDEDYFAKSHAARQQGLLMGLYNLINSVQNYYANDFKRRQFNDTMDLYRSLNKLDWDKYNYWLKNNKSYPD